jgi:hypothetical protein
MTTLIMIGATLAYFAITIPLATWVGRRLSRRRK